MKRMKKITCLAAAAIAMTMSRTVQAQTAVGEKVADGRLPVADYFFNPLFYLAVFMVVLIVLVIYALVLSVYALTNQLAPEKARTREKKEAPANSSRRLFAWVLMDRLTRSVPVEKERDILLDHNYDGIRELDNQLPPWWKWGFYLTIVFAVVYMLYYHASGGGKLMAAEYSDEMNKAAMEKSMRMKEAKNNVTEENVVVLTSAEEIASGKNLFTANCVTCHGPLAQGTPTAPNLTDAYWLHGGGIKNVFHTITAGVPGKAMISWSQKLSPRQINEVASYVLALQGSKPEGAKEPEGELYAPEAVQASATADSVKKD